MLFLEDGASLRKLYGAQAFKISAALEPTHTREAASIRTQFTSYFMSVAGQLPWQFLVIHRTYLPSYQHVFIKVVFFFLSLSRQAFALIWYSDYSSLTQIGILSTLLLSGSCSGAFKGEGE